jgi:hypothetical protein
MSPNGQGMSIRIPNNGLYAQFFAFTATGLDGQTHNAFHLRVVKHARFGLRTS